VAVAIVPMAVGMAIRGSPARLERPVRVVSVILFLGVIPLIVVQNLDALQAGIRSLCVWMLALSAGATAVTLGIEIGMQNVATATFVTVTLLGNATMALARAVYALVMLPAAVGLGLAARLVPASARPSSDGSLIRPRSGSDTPVRAGGGRPGSGDSAARSTTPLNARE